MASEPVKAVLIIGATLSLQGDAYSWAFMHRIHHRYCDDVLDFHSPIIGCFLRPFLRWERRARKQIVLRRMAAAALRRASRASPFSPSS